MKIVTLLLSVSVVMMIANVSNASQPVPLVTMTSDGATISTTLEKKGVIVLDGVLLCDKGIGIPNVYSDSSCTVEGSCRTIIFQGNTPLPKDLPIHSLVHGVCTMQTIPDISLYPVAEAYSSVIHLSPTTLKQMDIPARSKISGTENSTSIHLVAGSFNGDTTINLDYRTVKPQQDELSFGGKSIHIEYQ